MLVRRDYKVDLKEGRDQHFNIALEEKTDQKAVHKNAFEVHQTLVNPTFMKI